MPYRPKYCCQCGEKIDAIDWKWWSSRRFCELCATEFGIYDKANWALLGIGLLLGLYGIGSHFQNSDKPLNVESNQIAVSNRRSDVIQPKTATRAQVSVGNDVQMPLRTPVAPELEIKQNSAQIHESPEKVYFCGAPTKKGTMCSRRMKNGGRCWQHEGQAAMMPQEKLLVTQ